MSSKVTKSWVSLRTLSCKTPTNLTVNRCSVQTQVLNALTAITPPAVFPI